MRGRDLFRKFKYPINMLVKINALLPYRLRIWLLDRFRRKQGISGILIRYILLKSVAKSVGDNVCIYPDVYLLNVKNLVLGNNVRIHPFCYIDAQGGIDIGDEVSIAEGVSMISFNHNFNDINIDIKEQGHILGKIILKRNIWVGAKATILMNVVVDSGAIIAAGAVVTRDVGENHIVAGVPALPIKVRGQ